MRTNPKASPVLRSFLMLLEKFQHWAWSLCFLWPHVRYVCWECNSPDPPIKQIQCLLQVYSVSNNPFWPPLSLTHLRCTGQQRVFLVFSMKYISCHAQFLPQAPSTSHHPNSLLSLIHLRCVVERGTFGSILLNSSSADFKVYHQAASESQQWS